MPGEKQDDEEQIGKHVVQDVLLYCASVKLRTCVCMSPSVLTWVCCCEGGPIFCIEGRLVLRGKHESQTIRKRHRIREKTKSKMKSVQQVNLTMK